MIVSPIENIGVFSRMVGEVGLPYPSKINRCDNPETPFRQWITHADCLTGEHHHVS